MEKKTKILAVLFLALMLCMSSCSGCSGCDKIKKIIGVLTDQETTESASESGSETEDESSASDEETDESSDVASGNESDKESSKKESGSKKENDGISASGGSKEKSEEESSEETEKESSSEAATASEASHTHSFKHVAKVNPTCDKDGNIEYWQCTECYKCYKDSAATQYIEKPEDLILKATGHKLSFHKGYVSTSCLVDTTLGYFQCETCGRRFLEEEAKTEVKSDADLKVPGPHNLVKVPKVEPTCTNAGNKEHWACSYCSRLFEDAEGKVEIKDPALVVLYPLGHDLKHVALSMMGCETDGVKEHWVCNRCGRLFWDENAASECKFADLILPAKGHDYTKVQANPGCEDPGWLEHYECYDCGKYFKLDYTEVDDPTLFYIPPNGHVLNHYVEDYPCYDGYHEHYACPICGQWFALDKTTKVNKDDYFFKGKGHYYQEVLDEKGKRIYHSDGMRWLFRCPNCGDEVYMDPKG